MSCSSTETTEEANVLEPEEAPEVSAGAASTQSPTYKRVMEKLAALNYEGMGLQFENEQTLLILEQVFSDPDMAGRKIRLVYTGLEMSYDPQYESITIGGLTRPIDIVNYIKKKVPKKSAPK